MTNLERIQQVSQRLDWFVKSMLVIVPVTTFCYWMGFNYLPASLAPTQTYGVSELAINNRLLLCLISLIPLSIVIWCLWTLHRLFTLFSNNVFYHADNVRLFKALGLGITAWVVVDFVFTPVQSVIMTMNQPEGLRVVAVNFDLNDLVMLAAGAITMLIAWIVEEGRKIEEENSHTI